MRILVLALGGNDGLRGLPVDQMKRNLSRILALAAERGIRVLLAGMEAPPNFGAVYTAEFRAVFADLAREHDVAFMPFLLDGVAADPALNQADGIHPNADGAAIVAVRVRDALEPLLPARTHEAPRARPVQEAVARAAVHRRPRGHVEYGSGVPSSGCCLRTLDG